MRIVYSPESERVWANYYTNQALQHGGGFIGVPYQRGAGLGSLFGSIFRAILPVAKSVGKAVGRQALSTATGIGSDILAGKNFKESAKTRGRAAAANLLNKAAVKINQSGRGLGVRRTRKRKATAAPSRQKPKRARKPAKKTIKRSRKSQSRKRRGKDQFGFY